MENKYKQLSDNFLTEVVSILELGDFKFSKETVGTIINITPDAGRKLKDLCLNDCMKRKIYNELYGPNKTMNINWSYEVLNSYFNYSCN